MKFLIALSALVACGLAVEEAKVIATHLGYAGYPYAGYPYAAPAVSPYASPIAAAPVVAPYAAPYSAGSQFHAQDGFGNLNYGYANLNSVKQEIGNTYGGVSGGYSYVDANNELQQVAYVANGLGFQVKDSRLPVAPVYDGVAPTFNPEPLVAPVFNPEPLVAPEVTPEVAEATAAHLAAVEAAKADRKKREADPAFAYGFATAHPAYPFTTYAAGYPYNLGLGYHVPYLG